MPGPLSANMPAASLTPLTNWNTVASTTSGGTVADWVRINKSAMVPTIQRCGAIGKRQRDCFRCRAPFPNQPLKPSLFVTCCDTSAAVLPGRRTAIEERIFRPVVRISARSRETASGSTVTAGKISVSITTGGDTGSATMMSGRPLVPFGLCPQRGSHKELF